MAGSTRVPKNTGSIARTIINTVMFTSMLVFIKKEYLFSEK